MNKLITHLLYINLMSDVPKIINSESKVKPCMCAKSLQSCPTLCDPVDCRCQASLSTGFYRQEYWSGLPFSSPWIFPIQRSNLHLMSPALAGRFFTTRDTWEAQNKKNSPLSWQFCIVLSTQRGDSNFNFLQFSPAFPSV